VGTVSIGLVVGITPKRIKPPITTKRKPQKRKAFLVPQRFFSAQGILPNISISG